MDNIGSQKQGATQHLPCLRLISRIATLNGIYWDIDQAPNSLVLEMAASYHAGRHQVLYSSVRLQL